MLSCCGIDFMHSEQRSCWGPRLGKQVPSCGSDPGAITTVPTGPRLSQFAPRGHVSVSRGPLICLVMSCV